LGLGLQLGLYHSPPSQNIFFGGFRKWKISPPKTGF